MSDSIPVATQQGCADLLCEDEKYILDIYSCVHPERRGRNESRKQIFLFITRAEESSRSAFLQVLISLKNIEWATEIVRFIKQAENV